MKANIIKLQSHGDERGSLIALEQGVNIPFEIKRVYYIFDTKEGVARGHHAHQNLSQIAVVVRGSCDFVLDNGKERIDIRMDNPLEGLIMGTRSGDLDPSLPGTLQNKLGKTNPSISNSIHHK